jgi:hypothetical protein
MESMRKQNDLVNSVTKALVSVEGGIAVATGVLWRAAPAVVGIGLKTIAVCALAVIAIAACWVFVTAAISDLRWQGRFINYVKALEPSLFVEIDPKPKGRGLRAGLYTILGVFITAFWILAIVAAILTWCRS